MLRLRIESSKPSPSMPVAPEIILAFRRWSDRDRWSDEEISQLPGQREEGGLTACVRIVEELL